MARTTTTMTMTKAAFAACFARAAVLFGALGATPALAAPDKPAVDWPAFLGAQDLVWKRLPTRWSEGAFLGNGLVGAMIFADTAADKDKRALVFQLGRTDVTDHQK